MTQDRSTCATEHGWGDALASIVIPCLNAGSTLPATLSAIKAQSIAEDLEVIVVDDGSVDDSVAIAGSAGARVLFSEAHGSAAARNHGIRHSTARFILSLDADCVPCDNEWAERHLRVLEVSPTHVLGTAGATIPAPSADRWSQRQDITPHPAWSEEGEPLYGVAGNACYRRVALLEVGGFPPLAADDAALGLVARRGGWRFIWVPEASVFHQNPQDWRGYCRQMLKIGYYSGELRGVPRHRRSAYIDEVRRLASALRPLSQGDMHECAAIVIKTVAQGRGARRAWAEARALSTPGARWSAAFKNAETSELSQVADL